MGKLKALPGGSTPRFVLAKALEEADELECVFVVGIYKGRKQLLTVHDEFLSGEKLAYMIKTLDWVFTDLMIREEYGFRND